MFTFQEELAGALGVSHVGFRISAILHTTILHTSLLSVSFYLNGFIYKEDSP